MLKSGTKRQIIGWLVLFMVGRLLLISGRRLLFPFLPEIARGLSISIVELQQFIGWSALISLSAPFLVPLSERFGRKPFIVGGYVVFVVGALLAWFIPTKNLFAVSMFIIMFSHMMHDPNLQAYIGDIIPWEMRGRATGLIEFSWSLSLLLIAPIAALLIGRWGWRSPFLALGCMAIVIGILVWRVIPESRPKQFKWLKPRKMLQYIRQCPAMWAASGFALLTSGANQLVFISYAAWMEKTFALSLDGLGLTAVVIGSAELLGEIVMGFSTDRFGKKRVIFVAGIVTSVCYFLVPQFDTELVPALIIMFVLFFAFEITFISIIPIFSELIPESRTTAMASLSVSGRIGRSAGAFLVAPIALMAGFSGITLVAAVLTLLGVILVATRRDIAN